MAAKLDGQRNGMGKGAAATTETSVLASIDDLLREHQRSVAAEETEARRRAERAERARIDAMDRERAEVEARRQATEDDARRRAFEEQRREAELAAMHEATVQGARVTAEGQARLAELAARQEHERHLSALARDGGKKRWKLATALTALFLCVAVGGGGVALKVQLDKQRAAETELALLRDQIAQAEQEKAKIKAQLQDTKDPQRIAELTKELDDRNQTIGKLTTQLGNKGGTGPKPTVTATGTTPPTATAKPPTVCKCLDGDPTCSCIKI